MWQEEQRARLPQHGDDLHLLLWRGLGKMASEDGSYPQLEVSSPVAFPRISHGEVLNLDVLYRPVRLEAGFPRIGLP